MAHLYEASIMKAFLVLSVYVAGIVAQQTFPASIVVHPPPETVVTETKTVRFTCAAYGLPLPTIKWGKDTEEIVSDANSGFQIYTQTMMFGPTTFVVSVLEISGVNSTVSSNSIFCLAENEVSGPGLSPPAAIFSLVVDALDKEPAMILEPPSSQTVDRGSTVEAVCVAYGNPLPTISWSRVVPCSDGQGGECTRDVTETIYNDVATYGDTALSKSVLQLCNVSEDDAGLYRCTAWNDIGDQISTESAGWNLAVNLPITSAQPSSTSATPTPSMAPCDEARSSAEGSTGDNVQPWQIVFGIMVVVIVLLILAVVILALLYVNKARGKADIGGPGIAGTEDKLENPIYAEPSDEKTLID